MLMKVYFWLLFDKHLKCAYPLQGANQDSINKLNKGEYYHGWRKIMDILKQIKHLLFGGTKMWQGNNYKKIETTYKRFMSTLDNLSEMSLLFASIQIKAIENMVREDVVIFPNIWEVTN
jgi:hypothetical protein